MKFAAFILGLACLTASPLARAAGSAGIEREYELKAAVLYHIIEYVEWPKESLPNQSPTIQIGLLGNIAFADALEVLNGKTLQGRKLVVKKLDKPQDAGDCQVVFISNSEKPRVSEIVSEFKSRPVLTVSEVEGFVERGGMINLVSAQNRISMEINREVA